MTNEERIAAVHKALNDAGYEAVYGADVRKGWRIEGYTGQTNIIIEYIWHSGGCLTIGCFGNTPVALDSVNFPDWLKNQ